MVKTKKQYNKKYKIMDAKINKQLKNDEIILRYIPKDTGEPPRPPRGVPKWFTEFVETQFKPLVSRIDEQGKDIKSIFDTLERNNIR